MTPTKASTKDIVFQAIIDLCERFNYATREAIISETGLVFHHVDEAVKKLREEDGVIHRLKGNRFTVVKRFDEQPVSATVLDDGQVKVEHGDEMMTLTPRAARAVLALLGGFALLHGRGLVDIPQIGETRACTA